MWWKSNEELAVAERFVRNMKHFTMGELQCRDGSKGVPTVRTLIALRNLRYSWSSPMTIVSAYRSPEHNLKIGGALNSYHVKGEAIDVNTSGMNDRLKYFFVLQAGNAGFKGIGIYDNFIHLDIREEFAYW